MGLRELLKKNKSAIVESWIDFVANTYPIDTSQFLKSKADRFANPVGVAISEGLQSLFDELTGEPDMQKVREALDPIIRIRAIQDFTPSQATSFVLAIKTILKNQFKKKLEKECKAKEIDRFHANVDRVLFLAFDIYMECRERIYSLKANEERNKVYSAFERAGLIDEISDDPPKLKKSTN